jgi:hypothetical protein
MARKLPEHEEQTFGQNETSAHAAIAGVDESEFIQLLDQKRQQPMALSPELRIWLEHAFHVKVNS